MKIETDSRQMPSNKTITCEKDYSDLLYAWLQCNSERVHGSNQRRIHASKIKWVGIEKDFTREVDGKLEKIMSRKTIAKYFNHLLDSGLIEVDDDYFYLTVLPNYEAWLIEYRTLSKLMNVLQKNSLSVYVYLVNRYFANNCEPFTATMKNIKEFIGIATSTTSNNVIIADTLDILRRLGLLDYREYVDENCKSHMQFLWVKNRLP